MRRNILIAAVVAVAAFGGFWAVTQNRGPDLTAPFAGAANAQEAAAAETAIGIMISASAQRQSVMK